jgi:hypothetical protein
MYKRERPGCPKIGEWPLDDEIVALRLFGTDQVYELPPGAGAQTVGSSPTCDLVLRGHGGTVETRWRSRAPHARAGLVGVARSCPRTSQTLTLDSGVALVPRTSRAGVAAEAANPGAVRSGASAGDGCLALRRNCVSPSRADGVN